MQSLVVIVAVFSMPLFNVMYGGKTPDSRCLIINEEECSQDVPDTVSVNLIDCTVNSSTLRG